MPWVDGYTTPEGQELQIHYSSTGSRLLVDRLFLATGAEVAVIDIGEEELTRITDWLVKRIITTEDL